MNTHGRGRLLVAAVAAISAAGGTDALASAGCTAANSGALNADLSAGASVTRELALDAGDTLGITASGASAMLVSGAGAPLTLISVGGATAASLRAPQVDTFALRFSAGADGPATIRISCTSAQSAAADAAFLARRNDLVKAQDPDRIRLDRSPTPIANADKPLASTVDVDEEGQPIGDHRRRRAEAPAGPRRSLARRPHAELRGDRSRSRPRQRQPRHPLLRHAFDDRPRHPRRRAGAARPRRRGRPLCACGNRGFGLDGRPLSQHAAAERRHFRRPRSVGRDGERRPRRGGGRNAHQPAADACQAHRHARG
jgi:hypothetical protein